MSCVAMQDVPRILDIMVIRDILVIESYLCNIMHTRSCVHLLRRYGMEPTIIVKILIIVAALTTLLGTYFSVEKDVANASRAWNLTTAVLWFTLGLALIGARNN